MENVSGPLTRKEIQGFDEAVQSLKLYRRAELLDPEVGNSIIEDLYVDPSRENQILSTISRPHTTFLIGRKGTGKSTIFQRLQSELRKSNYQTSAYIDIKTLYESSQVDMPLLERLQNNKTALPPKSLEKLLLYRKFLQAVIEEIKSELKKRVAATIWARVSERLSGDIAQLTKKLDELFDQSNDDTFISVVGIRDVSSQNESSSVKGAVSSVGLSVNLGASPSMDLGKEKSESLSKSVAQHAQYSDVLLRSFDIRAFIERLKEVLGTLKIRHLHILIDDYSELPLEAMQVVGDVLLGPLNNWSDELIKFKVAAYPGRVYYGSIDKTKIDEVYLDIYKLYGAGDVSRMEDSAIDFTKRLVEHRIDHFCGRPASDFFEGNADELWKVLFYASMANPRTLGYLLHFIKDSHLIRGKRIGVSAIQEAAEKFYTEKIESYFAIGKFLHESFQERASIFSLKELVEGLVSRARALRGHESEVMKKISGRPPTSHFHVPIEYEPLFSTLELNFFLTKYFEMSDRSGKKVVVFALNYGLCSKYKISFGRPVGEREFRLYFVERVFDYSSILKAYLDKNQEIICESCGQRYSYEHLEALKFYGMLCKECKVGKVTVVNLSRKYEAELNAVSKELLLPTTELGILQSLHFGKSPLRPGRIAGELDCSYQLVGKRGKNLSELGLIKRYHDEQSNRLFEITDDAESRYFSPEAADDLDIPEADPV